MSPSPLAEGLRGELEGKKVEVGKALVVRGKVLEMDPGSRAARYWPASGPARPAPT